MTDPNDVSDPDGEYAAGEQAARGKQATGEQAVRGNRSAHRERSVRGERAARGKRVLTAPPTVLVLSLTALALLLHGAAADRLGADLAGGALLPVGDLAAVWSAYLDAWHGVAGGTTSAGSPALAVLGAAGALLGGPAVAVSLLLLLDLPASALVAYAATRRLNAGRWARAGAAAGYALAPAATDAVASGRIGVVVVHLALPAVVAGIAALLTGSEVRLLPLSAVCALGLALLGVFSPLTYGMVLAGLLIGFVVLPAPEGRSWKRLPAMVMVVLLPLALALPWLPTLVAHPELLLHGLTGPADAASVAGLAGLHPSGGVPLGLVLVVVAAVAVATAASARMAAGAGLVAIGCAGVAVTQLVQVEPITGGGAAPAYAGAPLVVVTAGLVAIVLGGRRGAGDGGPRTAVAGGVAVTLVLLATAAFLGGGGEVRSGGGVRLPAALDEELDDNGRGVLVLGSDGTPDRMAAGRTPQFGDDALSPVGGMAERLEGWRYGLLGGSRDAVTNVAAAGVEFVVLPAGENGRELRTDVSDLVSRAPRTSDGRTVLRLTPEAGQVTLVSPEQAHHAVSGSAPSDELMRGAAIAPVDAQLPDARVRVSAGPDGRLLVLAAEYEPGWSATIDGEPVPITPAWGHQVSVAVPEAESEVVVRYTAPWHSVLLLIGVAALLFTVLTAVPGRLRTSRST
ncbi:YfhO family protein [Prauserella halophila]|uniref:YfhO family protein n=1 Tax=Prauserella halophila TaxID=185641 RepID=UPI0020A3044B|nr:YfhO family protein [Prauserella halophila]